MILGSSTLVFSRIFSTLLGFVNTGMITRYLNSEEFGIWALIMSMPGLFAGFDLGFSSSLKNKLSELFGQKKDEQEKQYFLSVFYCFAILAISVIIVFLIFNRYIPMDKIFHGSQNNVTVVGAKLINVNIIIILLGIPLSLALSAGFYSYQESHINSLFTILSYGLIFALVSISIMLHWTLYPIVIIYLFTGLLIYIVSMSVFMIRRKWEFVKLSVISIVSKVKELLPNSLQFVMMQIGAGLFYSVDPFIIGQISGLGQVGDYYLVKKIAFMVVITHLSSLGATWPAHTEAIASGDYSWAKKTLKYAAITTIILFSIFTVIFTIFGQTIIHIWTRKIISQQLLFFSFGVWALLFAWANCFSIFLNAINKLKLQLLWCLISLLLVIPMSLFLGKKYGVLGVCWAQIILLLLPAISNSVQTIIYFNKSSSENKTTLAY